MRVALRRTREEEMNFKGGKKMSLYEEQTLNAA